MYWQKNSGKSDYLLFLIAEKVKHIYIHLFFA